MKQQKKQQALELRKAGYSYNLIRDKLGVSKSTLSLWLRNVPFVPNQEVRGRVSEGLLKFVMSRHAVKLESFKQADVYAAERLGDVSDRDLFMLGVGLYIGEGVKLQESTHFINSNPDVIRLAMRWFRESLLVPNEHFRVLLHIYPDIDEDDVKQYWAEVTNLPLSQFEKTQVDRRQNKSLDNRGKLPYGTAHIKIRACGNPTFGVLFHRQIMGIIKGVYKQTRV